MNKSTKFHREQYDKKYSQVTLKPNPHFKRQFEYLCRWSQVKSGNIRVLDLGCGTGEYSLILESMGFDITSVDISPVAIEKAKKLGVKNAICEDFLNAQLENKFDLILVKGFSPLNVDSAEEFRSVVYKIDSLLSPDGVIFYWGITDFSGSWTKSGWYNWNPMDLDDLFEWQVHLVFRWQSFLPIRLNHLISTWMISMSWPKRKNTLIGLHRAGSIGISGIGSLKCDL
jgi:SAM-dependent methyltransferase